MEKGVPIRSVSRSISVLQAINRHGSLSMMAIAKHEKLPYPTAFRIVQTLIHEGLIEQEPVRKRYRPTALVQSLAHGYHTESRIVDVAREPMRALTREVGWPCFITVRVGTQMVVRDSTHAETSLTFGLCHPGFTVPLLQSATGQAFLANVPAQDLDDLIRWGATDESHEPKIDMDAFMAGLREIRRDGFAAKPCLTPSVHRSSSIAVPIFREGSIEAVLTLVYFYTAMKSATAIERYVDRMKASAAEISRNFAAPQLEMV